MAEAITTNNPQQKTKSKPTSGAAGFEMPKFDMPKFDMPKMEVPAAFREFAEKGVAQAKDHYEKLKAVAEETTDVLEETYAKTSKGASEYGLKLIETSRVNTNAAFDFLTQLLAAKTISEVVELSTAHAREQFDTVVAQSKELASLAQKVTTESVEPIKNGMTNAFQKAA